MLSRNPVRTVFHSMFDVGRSVFDVRLALAAAIGRSTGFVAVPDESLRPKRADGIFRLPGPNPLRCVTELLRKAWVC